MTAVAGLHVQHHEVDLVRPWGPDVQTNHLLATEVVLDDGRWGHGFTWTPSIGAAAVRALLDHDIRSWLVGRPVDDPAETWDALWFHLHEAGGGGLTTIAMAGVDLALWDLRLRARGVDLATALGRRREQAAVYGSGVNLHCTTEELEDQARRWVAAGHDAVKIKVGRDDLAEDVDRVGRVRAVLGPDRALMVDANQRWELDRAAVAIDRLGQFDLHWVEEPLRADDTAGYRRLRQSVDVPVAQGENAHTVHRFRDLLDADAVDVVQPNVVRVGGITPFLRIADLAHERGVRLAPHLLPELAGPLALALPDPAWVELVEDADLASLGILARPSPITVAEGRLSVGTEPGLGIRLDPGS